MEVDFGLLFFVLALSMIAASTFSPFALPLLWPALSLIIVGAGYLGLGSRVFAKTEDGAIPMVLRVVLLPYFMSAWVILESRRRVTDEPVFNRVRRGLLLGRRPDTDELPDEVTHVLDLSAEYGRTPNTATRVYWCLPTLDAAAPEPAAFASMIKRVTSLPEESVVYVHCAAGHGRAATFAAAWLLARGHARDIDDAEAQLQLVRPAVHLRARQRRALVEFVA